MDESEVREQELHDRRMAREKAAREHLAAVERDAERYRATRAAFYKVRRRADEAVGRTPPSEAKFNNDYDARIDKDHLPGSLRTDVRTGGSK